MTQQTAERTAEEIDAHYRDCELNMGAIRHESHGELCVCDPKCDCSATKDIASAIHKAVERTCDEMVKVSEDRLICSPPEQYGDKCENCDGVLEPEACQCSGVKSVDTALRIKASQLIEESKV